MSDILENYRKINENIEIAAKKSGRNLTDITLIGVTKTVDTGSINELISAGCRNIGENRVQEILDKYPSIGNNADWHLIGHLQSNKVKAIIDKVKMIHSVDSFRIAGEINKRAAEIGRKIPVLVEINIADEKSKYGISERECSSFLKELNVFDSIVVKGLMTVAPFVENPEENRVWFRKMRKLFVDNQSVFMNNISMEFLSMGMSNDYEIAIEEGSNMVRIGTAIFGARNIHK